MEENNKKNKILGMVAIAVIFVIVLIVVFISKKTKFEIKDFSISKEVVEYEYIDDTVYYEGEGTIITKDKKGTYIVVVRRKLISGGKKGAKTENVSTVIVTEGKGQFATFDSGSEGEIEKPKYEFEVLGYIKLK